MKEWLVKYELFLFNNAMPQFALIVAVRQ